MNVQPRAVMLLDAINLKTPGAVVLFEGDRLFNQKFINTIKEKYEMNIFMLTVNPELIEQRHTDRGDTQTEVWKKSRKTKLANILNNNQGIKLLPNNNETEQENNIQELLETIWQDLKNTT